MILIDLFWTLFKIGAFTFGGGYAMLPMLQRVVVDEKKWATEEEILDVRPLAIELVDIIHSLL